jgi:alanyl-tRNA synthetase
VTTRIYYTDPYCRRFDARVTDAFDLDRRPAVVLDRTAFYPSSGGQPFDIGRLGGAAVVDVADDERGVVHVLSAPLAAGAVVGGEIDWARRFDHMQQHTGQHLLSAAFDRLFENQTVGFHMGAETSTIDLAREASHDELARAEEEANRIVWEDRDVSIRFVDPSKRDPSSPPLQLRKESAREGVLRLIEVAGFDLSACGGTHVARTGAIGLIAVAAAEKIRGGTRVTFVCGDRALRVFRTLRLLVTGATRALSVLPAALPAAIERMQAEDRDLRRTVKRLQQATAAHEAGRLTRESSEVSGVRIVTAALDWDAGGLKTIAATIVTTTPAVVALVSSSAPFDIVIARSPDVPVAAQQVLRALLDRFGGRGGGKPDLAQGGGLAGDAGTILDAARRLISDPS